MRALVEEFISYDDKEISWSRALREGIQRGRSISYTDEALTSAVYRPFIKSNLYFHRSLINDVALIPKLFPRGAKNVSITVTSKGAKSFSAFIVEQIPDLNIMEAGSQCFPLYFYEEATQANSGDLFAEPIEGGFRRKDAITDAGLAHFHVAFPGEQISKEDLFYYIYGILHSPDYRERYADNLSKELPRIPAVKKASDFWTFSRAGRALADLHLNYETVEPYPLTIEAKGPLTNADYRVDKMKFAKKGDKSLVIYNHRITLKGIPEAAWDYVVNGKAALDWVMERQAVRTDKASGIVNDANDWATETVGNPKYPLELFQRVITVSLKTQSIVNGLPALDI